MSQRTSAYALGAAALSALAYAILAEPFGFSWGLIVVGLIGGAAIGYFLKTGPQPEPADLQSRSDEYPTERLRRRGQYSAVALAMAAWLIGLALAYVLSQVLYQAATTPLTSRLSLPGLWEYAQIALLPRAIALGATVMTAWRSAR